MAAELRRGRGTKADLAERPTGVKVPMGWRVRQQGTLTLKRVPQRLRMGSRTSVSNALVQKRKQGKKCK